MVSPYLKRTISSDPDFRLLIDQLDAELRQMYNDLMDTYDQHNIIEPIGTVIIAYLNNCPVGCGCFKPYSKQAVEIKRMFITPTARGRGISKLIINELEAWARELKFTYTVLETGSKNSAALNLYQKTGYLPIPKYEPYTNLPDSFCFRKTIV